VIQHWFEKHRELQQRRHDEGFDGFTLIELLIVIVVLGILAAVVVFALGGVTGQSAQAACNADAKTVEVALAAYNAQNGAYPTTDITNTASSNTAGMSPYIHSWPSNAPHYAVKWVAASNQLQVAVPATGTFVSYDTANPCGGAQ
jgi:general secretion pathway protein G